MEYFNGILAVTHSELTRCDDGDAVITINNYRVLQQRHNLTVLRPGKGLDHPALIEWSSMPTRFKEKFVSKYGDPEITMSRKNEPLDIDQKAYKYFDRREVNGMVLSDVLRDRYVLNASVLNRLIDNINRQKAGRGAKGNGTGVNWDAVFSEYERLKDLYGHTLPKSRLLDKIREYQVKGYECLISGKLGNSNTSKLSLNSPAGEWVTAMMRCRYPKMSIQDIQAAFNQVASEKGWKPIKSEATFRNFVYLPEVRCKWADTVEGELALREVVTVQHSTKLPAVRDMLWYGDGTKINFFYKAYVDGKYKAATLWMFAVIDACSEVLLGYSVGTTENFEMMYRAYRNALEFAGHKPYELVFDGQGGTRRDDAKYFFSNISVISRYAMPFHGNSKTIENVFARLQGQVMRKRDNYTGGNITASSSRSRVDMEYINANVENLPTYTELLEEVSECVQEWNSSAHPNQRLYAGMSRSEVYLSTVNPKAPELTEDMKRDMWMIPITEAAYTQRGMCFTYKGQPYEYIVKMPDGKLPDLKWARDNMQNKFEVLADPLALGDETVPVRLCSVSMVDNGKGKKERVRTFVTEAWTKPVIHRAIGEQEDWEMSYIRQVQEAGKEMRVGMQIEAVALESKYGISPEQNGKNSPKLQGISGKEFERIADKLSAAAAEPEPSEVMADSIGQIHKQQSYADRM